MLIEDYVLNHEDIEILELRMDRIRKKENLENYDKKVEPFKKLTKQQLLAMVYEYSHLIYLATTMEEID